MVYLPRHSSSLELLLVNLGDVSVKNHFHLKMLDSPATSPSHSVTSVGGHDAALPDVLDVTADDLSLASQACSWTSVVMEHSRVHLSQFVLYR